MRALPAATSVVIVGAGPTGLTLACVLADRGVPFVLFDRLAEAARTSRAAAIHARTLEVLEEVGVVDRLRAEGHVVPRFTLRDRERVLATIDLAGLPTRYPFALMIPQDRTERILLERLQALGGEVFRPYAVEDLRPEEDGLTVTVAPGGPRRQTLRAAWVVGADGMHSTVRERAGIGFVAAAYEESFVLADVRMAWPLPPDEGAMFVSPAGLVVVAPLPGGRHRVVATLDDPPEHPGAEDVQRLLDARGPAPRAAAVQEVVWGSRFRVHHRLADRYRAGRVLLAGDAAHVHSPAGGQGLNTGVRDAVALGHALAATLAAGDDEGPLLAYERERRPVAERVLAFTDRITRLATVRSAPGRALRNTAFRVAGRIPAMRRRLATELAGLGRAPPGGAP